MSKAKFIVIEGLEGAGKSTAVNVVKDFLKEQNDSEIVQCREPGGTQLGETIRDLVKSNKSLEKIDPRTELLLMYASRIQLVENVIKPALESGDSVICDRFYYSTYAYQGGGREIDLSIIDSIHEASLGSFKPDLTIYMDIDPKVGLQRAAVRGELDRFELEKIDFFNKTRDMYLKMAAESNEVKTVDAAKSIEDVAGQVRSLLKSSGL